jgi:hypothetical protein
MNRLPRKERSRFPIIDYQQIPRVILLSTLFLRIVTATPTLLVLFCTLVTFCVSFQSNSLGEAEGFSLNGSVLEQEHCVNKNWKNGRVATSKFHDLTSRGWAGEDLYSFEIIGGGNRI